MPETCPGPASGWKCTRIVLCTHRERWQLLCTVIGRPAGRWVHWPQEQQAWAQACIVVVVSVCGGLQCMRKVANAQTPVHLVCQGQQLHLPCCCRCCKTGLWVGACTACRRCGDVSVWGVGSTPGDLQGPQSSGPVLLRGFMISAIFLPRQVYVRTTLDGWRCCCQPGMSQSSAGKQFRLSTNLRAPGGMKGSGACCVGPASTCCQHWQCPRWSQGSALCCVLCWGTHYRLRLLHVCVCVCACACVCVCCGSNGHRQGAPVACWVCTSVGVAPARDVLWLLWVCCRMLCFACWLSVLCSLSLIRVCNNLIARLCGDSVEYSTAGVLTTNLQNHLETQCATRRQCQQQLQVGQPLCQRSCLLSIISRQVNYRHLQLQCLLCSAVTAAAA